MLDGISRFVSRHRPSMILVEGTSGGLALVERLRRKNVGTIVVIPAPAASKIDRLKPCVETIKTGRVRIESRALFRDEFVAELTEFPHADSDDQADAMTQFLNYMALRPDIPPRPNRAVASLWTATGITASGNCSKVALAADGAALGVYTPSRRWY